MALDQKYNVGKWLSVLLESRSIFKRQQRWSKYTLWRLIQQWKTARVKTCDSSSHYSRRWRWAFSVRPYIYIYNCQWKYQFCFLEFNNPPILRNISLEWKMTVLWSFYSSSTSHHQCWASDCLGIFVIFLRPLFVKAGQKKQHWTQHLSRESIN